jgi:protein-tyrosine phosphatase
MAGPKTDPCFDPARLVRSSLHISPKLQNRRVKSSDHIDWNTMEDQTKKESKPSNIPPWAWIKCVRGLTDPHKRKRYESNVELPVELTSWLLLSDFRSTMSLAKLKQHNVTHILSVHEDFPHVVGRFEEMLKGTAIVRKHIYCEDEEGYDMIENHWNESLEFLRTVEANVGRVMVHCMAGINRSGLIACAAQMVLERQPLVEIVRHTIDRRQTLLWNRSFQRQLCEMAQQEDLLGLKPEGYDDESPYEPPLPPPPEMPFLRLLGGKS